MVAGQDVFSALGSIAPWLQAQDARHAKQIAIDTGFSRTFSPPSASTQPKARSRPTMTASAPRRRVVTPRPATLLCGDPKNRRQSVLLDGVPTGVAGILPVSFRFTAAPTSSSQSVHCGTVFMNEPGNHNGTYAIGRLQTRHHFWRCASADEPPSASALEQAYPNVKTQASRLHAAASRTHRR